MPEGQLEQNTVLSGHGINGVDLLLLGSYRHFDSSSVAFLVCFWQKRQQAGFEKHIEMNMFPWLLMGHCKLSG